MKTELFVVLFLGLAMWPASQTLRSGTNSEEAGERTARKLS
jgi:hypothetical protein